MSTSAFDNSAATYDEDFTHTAIGRMQRARVYNYLLPLLGKSTRLLEVNCGTGHDALSLAPRVHSVLATDVSEEMIGVAKKKLIGSTVKNVTFKAVDLRSVHKSLGGKQDLVLSDFGGLNCIDKPALQAFADQVAPCMNPKGKLVLVLMSQKCLIENLWYLLHRDKRLNRRNTMAGVTTTVNGSTFTTWYYSPEQVTKIFSEHFRVKKIRPVGLLIPPSYLDSYFHNKKWLLQMLNLGEKLFAPFGFLSNYADHYLVVLEKRNPGSWREKLKRLSRPTPPPDL